jgi:DNA modification methylase
MTGAICPHCQLHRGHRANCPTVRTDEQDLSLAAYRQFLKEKIVLSEDFGFEIEPDEIHPWFKPHQRVAIQWGVRGGRRALFESFGLGKSGQQLEIVRLILKRVGGRGLIVAPLGVRQEFARDAETLGIDLKFIRTVEEARGSGTYITNYETVRDGKLNPAHFNVASLDEAAILAGFGAVKTFREFMRLFESVKYRFVATATPDPNEYVELLAFAAFLGIMEVSQAKTRWFKRDSTKADKLTLHPHKEREFWMWVASWALFLNKPSDFGAEFSDEGYALPPLEVVFHEVAVDHAGAQPERDGQQRMYRDATHGVTDAAREKRDTLPARISEMRKILDAQPSDHFLLWHDLEAERHAIKAAVPTAIDVFGLQRASKEGTEKLETAIIDFADGRIQYLAAKPSMFGVGANLQRHCYNAVFCGIGYSFRSFIQALHRVYRFLQTRKVAIHIIYAESEKLVLENLLDKWERHKRQLEKMSEIIREYGLSRAAMDKALSRSLGTERYERTGSSFRMVNNDCVEELHAEASLAAENSVDLILTSPPFSHMYEYSPSYSDFGHTDGNEHFFRQMDFLTPQLLRVLKPGRIAAVHVKDRIVPGGLTGLGFQTVYPFHADCIRHFQKHGFALIGMKTIVTDVVRENNQTYRLGWTEQCKDGSKMGVGMPEYLLLFRKPPSDPANAYADEPVLKEKPLSVSVNGKSVPFDRSLPIQPGTGYSRSRWQIDAHGFSRSSGDRLLRPEDLEGLTHEQIFKLFRKHSYSQVYDFEQHVRIGEELEAKGILPVTFMLLQPQSWHPDVWTDITRMRTLNSSQAAKGKEMHLCAMQLDLVNRVIAQMSMPGETVLDPFAGIGTVPQCAIALGRKAFGIELSSSYWLDAVGYCRAAEEKISTPTLFDLLEQEA